MKKRILIDRRNKYQIEPDRDLLNWERWIKIRNDEVANISQRINRPPVDLIMNLPEKVREDKEWKSILQNAQIDKKPTVRGLLWERPERLKQNCYCQPVYEVHRKREEIGRPRIVEHIGVPRYILENEKGVYGIPERKKCLHLDKQYIEYKQKREEELQEKIKKIDPFKSQIGELLIKGCKPEPETKPLPILPEIVIKPMHTYYMEEDAVYAIRINNTIFLKNPSSHRLAHLAQLRKEAWHESCSTWLYYFNVPVKRIGRAKLFLQNLGTASLRYCWRKTIEHISFVPEEGLNQVFYFNKNEDILNPGQSRDIYFTFVSSTTGIYNETWELGFVNVTFIDNLSKKLLINLQADSVEDVENSRYDIDVLKIRLNRKAVRKLIRNLLNEVVDKAACVEPKICPYRQLLLESELFIIKNPVCYYHQTKVMKLKDVYTEMVPEGIWDLSIKTWRDDVMKKDFVDRMRLYNILKQSHCELLKPWDESDDHLKQKYYSVKLILSQLANKFDEVYAELIYVLGNTEQSTDINKTPSGSKTILNYEEDPLIHMLFYMRMYDHLKTAIKTCAGVIMSIDSNRWIKFDFCQV